MINTNKLFRSYTQIFLLFLIILLNVSCFNLKKDPGFSKVPFPQNINEQNADLIIEGKINSASEIYLDLNTIVQYPSITFTCTDPWDNKEHTYTGVSLSGLMNHIGIKKDCAGVKVTAKNNYNIPVKRPDFEKYEYIIAYKIDDLFFSETETSKNKGKFIIAVNFSKHKELDTEIYKHQLVWQIVRITAF